MPLYEYVCESDGEVIELLRPMADADKPVEDPKGKGRVFKRRQSTFAAQGTSSGAGGMPLPMAGGCCPCGNPAGPCNAR